ncbi:MAG: hypothetical protein WDM88_04405 [Galbitalea sp.]
MTHFGLTVVSSVAILAVVPALSVQYREFLDRTGLRASARLTAIISISSLLIWLAISFFIPTVWTSPLEYPTAALAAVAGFLASLTVRDTTSRPLPAALFSAGWTALVFVPVAIVVLFPASIGIPPTAGPLDLGGRAARAGRRRRGGARRADGRTSLGRRGSLPRAPAVLAARDLRAGHLGRLAARFRRPRAHGRQRRDSEDRHQLAHRTAPRHGGLPDRAADPQRDHDRDGRRRRTVQRAGRDLGRERVFHPALGRVDGPRRGCRDLGVRHAAGAGDGSTRVVHRRRPPGRGLRRAPVRGHLRLRLRLHLRRTAHAASGAARVDRGRWSPGRGSISLLLWLAVRGAAGRGRPDGAPRPRTGRFARSSAGQARPLRPRSVPLSRCRPCW